MRIKWIKNFFLFTTGLNGKSRASNFFLFYLCLKNFSFIKTFHQIIQPTHVDDTDASFFPFNVFIPNPWAMYSSSFRQYWKWIFNLLLTENVLFQQVHYFFFNNRRSKKSCCLLAKKLLLNVYAYFWLFALSEDKF